MKEMNNYDYDLHIYVRKPAVQTYRDAQWGKVCPNKMQVLREFDEVD